MPGKSFTIGPWLGGLNLADDRSNIADDQLSECLNYDYDMSGALISRPSLIDSGKNMTLGVSGDIKLLGMFYADNGTSYLLGSDGLSSTYYFNGTAWTLVSNTFAASSFAQFDHKAYLMAPLGAANPGGYWTPTGGFVADSNMPKGDILVAHKYRLWAAQGVKATSNHTRLYYSAILGAGPLWALVNEFIDIGAGDGETLVSMVVYYNNMLIFRTSSIYSLNYDSAVEDGQVIQMVPGIGLSNADSIVSYEDSVYFMYNEKAYRFINNRVQQLNEACPFSSGSVASLVASPFSVSLLGKRILYSYYDYTYAFSLYTKSWSRWKTTTYGSFGKVLQVVDPSGVDLAYTTSGNKVALGGSRVAKLLTLSETVGSSGETFTCEVSTKSYDFDLPEKYKRLFWWGVDIAFRSQITGYAVPDNLQRTITWGQYLSGSWGDALNYTWGSPTQVVPVIDTTYSAVGLTPGRRFVKMLRGERFRKMYFRVAANTTGGIDTAPVRLFRIAVMVRDKAVVTAAVS